MTGKNGVRKNGVRRAILRFTQVDPIAMASASLGNPQSNNLYAYVQNMPTDLVDPSGLLIIIARGYNCRMVELSRGRNIFNCVMNSNDAAISNTREALNTIRDNAFNSISSNMVGGGVLTGGAFGAMVTMELGPGVIAGAGIGAVSGGASSAFAIRSAWTNMRNDVNLQISQLGRTISGSFSSCRGSANVH